MKLPKARTENLVEQNLGKETLIYDLLIDKAFNLNETSSIVYKACNGVTTFEELKGKHKFSDEFIYLALDELKRNDLLAENDGYLSPFGKVNRREVIRKVGLASMLALPVIVSLSAPQAAAAASPVCGVISCGAPFAPPCADPCPICTSANAVCDGSTEPCTTIGASCTATGTCNTVGGPFAFSICSVGAQPCSTPGAPCTGTATCTGSGTCTR